MLELYDYSNGGTCKTLSMVSREAAEYMDHLTYFHIICLTLIYCVVASYDLVGFFLKFLGVGKKEDKTQLQGFFRIIYHDSSLLKELKAR